MIFSIVICIYDLEYVRFKQFREPYTIIILKNTFSKEYFILASPDHNRKQQYFLLFIHSSKCILLYRETVQFYFKKRGRGFSKKSIFIQNRNDDLL